MPIGFARCVFVQRSRGHSVLAAAAYIGRARLVAPYPHFDYADREDLLAPMQTLLPPAAPERLHDPFALWHEVELTSPRKDSSLGLHLMLALPSPTEMAAQLCEPLIKQFIQTVVLPHGLAASFAVHDPHKQNIEDSMAWLERLDHAPKAPSGSHLAARNRHGHVLISPRRVGTQGVESRRYTALDPTQVSANSTVRGIAFVRDIALGGIDWPELWMRHQNDFFARHGLGLRVRPWAAFSDYHRGNEHAAKHRPERPGELDDDGPKVGDKTVERANRAAMSDPDKLLALAGRRPFIEPDLRGLVERYVGLGHPYDPSVADLALALPQVVRLGDPHSGMALPWLATHELAWQEQSCIVLAASLMDSSALNFDTSGLIGQTASASQGRLTIAETNAGLLMAASGAPLKTSPPDAVRVVAIDHGWGLPSGVKHSVAPSSLGQRLQPSDVMVLDYADTLTADSLVLLFRASLEVPNVRLILLRRPHAALHPRNPLIDIVAKLMGFDPGPGHHKTGSGMNPYMSNGLERAIDDLQTSGNIIFLDRADLLTTATDINDQWRRAGRRPSVICPDYELGALMRFSRLPVSRQAQSQDAILVHCRPSFGDLTILPLLTSTLNPILLVDRTCCPDMDSLRAQAAASTTAPCAIALPMAIDEAKRLQHNLWHGAAAYPSIRWAVDHNGHRGSSPEHILACLRSTYELELLDDETGHLLPPGPALNALLELDSEGINSSGPNWPDQMPESPEDIPSHYGADGDDDPDPDSALDVAEDDTSESKDLDDNAADFDDDLIAFADDQ